MTKWPKCEYCGTVNGVFRCRICYHFTCGECTTYIDSMAEYDEDVQSECHHEKFVPVKGDNWKSLPLLNPNAEQAAISRDENEY